MSKEALTHLAKNARKSNSMIAIVAFVMLGTFLFCFSAFGKEYDSKEIELLLQDKEERPITIVPEQIDFGEIVLGDEASAILTIGTNGRQEIRVLSVELVDAPFDGLEYEADCREKDLRGKETCFMMMRWAPSVAGNVQSSLKIRWQETNKNDKSVKEDEVAVIGRAIAQSDSDKFDNGNVRYAIGPDGKNIGYVDIEGKVYAFNGNLIGQLRFDGMIFDKDGNILGVAGNGKVVLDENGAAIGYVDTKGKAYNLYDDVIGTMSSDETIVDENDKVIGKAVDYGAVYENGNFIGRVNPDGSIIDLDGNFIGQLDKDGKSVDLKGNILGQIFKAGEAVLDDDGNVLGIVLPNGDIIGMTDANGKVRDTEGNTIGHLREKYHDSTVDKNNVVRKQ